MLWNFILSLFCLVASPQLCSVTSSLSSSEIMKDFYYSLIIMSPTVACVAVFFVVVYLVGRNDETRRERFLCWAATNLFSGIIKKKTSNRDETRWLIKNIDLTEEPELLTKVLVFFLVLSFILICSVSLMFWQILLLDVTYNCEPNSESTMDCFEYNLWNPEASKTFSRDPINCNSAAVQNGTVQVVCYKLVFRLGLASGASYGGFKLSMAVLNLATTRMLKATNLRTVCIIRTIAVFVVGLVSLGIILTILFLRVILLPENVVIISQIALVSITLLCCVQCFPWNDFVALRERENEQATGLENPAANVAENVV